MLITKNDRIYNKVEKLYKKNLEEMNREEHKSTPREIIVKVYIAILIGISLVIVFAVVFNNAILEFVFSAILIVLTFLLCFIDNKIHAEEYNKAEQKRMSCVKKTIREYLEIDDIDFLKELVFIEEFDAVSKRTTGYIIKRIMTWAVCLAIAFCAFLFGRNVGTSELNASIGGVLVIFAIQGLLNANFYKKILLDDRHFQRIIKQYKECKMKEYSGIEGL